MNKISGVGGAVLMVSYIGLGLLQLAAIMAGFIDWWGWHPVIGFIAAFFVTWLPIIGSIAGVGGAVTVWDWHWLAAAALFFWPIILYGLLGSGILAFIGINKARNAWESKQSAEQDMELERARGEAVKTISGAFDEQDRRRAADSDR